MNSTRVATQDPIADLLDIASMVCSLLTHGFIPPEDESDEFVRGWEAACKEFGRLARAGPVGMSFEEVIERAVELKSGGKS